MIARPDAFLSYTRFDDRRGKISEFRTWLADAVEEVEPPRVYRRVKLSKDKPHEREETDPVL